MIFSQLDALARPVAQRLHANHMARFGIDATMKLAGAYNRLKHGRTDAARRALYRDQWKSLIEENGPPRTPPTEMKDGWALDLSGSLPHLDEFSHPRGSVLFIKSSGCLHFGSRDSIKPRFQLMLGYHGVCRTDFAELVVPQKSYPIHPGDSRLRKLVLNREFLP